MAIVLLLIGIIVSIKCELEISSFCSDEFLILLVKIAKPIERLHKSFHDMMMTTAVALGVCLRGKLVRSQIVVDLAISVAF